MREAPSPTFETAEAQLATLTGRQRQVLELVAQGHTNPEIAEALGISLDGAKWHVSELLGKLDLGSREELAEFWAWQRRPAHRFSRVAHAFAATAWLRIAGGLAGVALMAGIGVGAWALFSGGSSVDEPVAGTQTSTAAQTPPFVLRAEFARTGADNTPGGLNPGLTTTQGTMEWWYRSSTDWKWTVATNPGQLDGVTTTVAAHDGTLTSYDGATNTYRESDAAASGLPEGAVLSPSMGVFIGPMSSYAKDTDAFVAMLQQSGDDSRPRTASVTGNDVILGRPTVVMETPGSYSSSSDTPGAETPDGTMRIWLDPERMVVMKTEVETSDGLYRIAVTALDWDASVPAAQVRFEPPDGATLAEGDDSGGIRSGSNIVSQEGMGSSEGGSFQAPPPFFEPAHTPEGVQLQQVMQETSSGSSTPVFLTADYGAADGGDARLTLQESLRAGGLPDALKAGTPTPVGANAGWLSFDGTTATLAWQQDDVALVITAVGVVQEEVITMAASMRRGTSAKAGIGDGGEAPATPVTSIEAN